MKLIPSIPQETDDVTSDFNNTVANAKDCGILFILLLTADQMLSMDKCPEASNAPPHGDQRNVIKIHWGRT